MVSREQVKARSGARARDRGIENWGRECPLLPNAVTAEDVLRAHFMLAEYFQRREEGLGGLGPRSLHLLQSAVSRQYVSLGNTQKWSTVYELTATLFFGIIKNHPFFD